MKEGESILVPSNTIEATFEDVTLPPFVLVLGKRIYLKSFISRTYRYLHCQRFGHTIKICKNLKSPAICARCGVSGHSEDVCCVIIPGCVNCKRVNGSVAEHRATVILPARTQAREDRDSRGTGESRKHERRKVALRGVQGIVDVFEVELVITRHISTSLENIDTRHE